MANLNAWQRIDKVLPTQPWGTGIDGDASISGTWGGGNGGHVVACTGTAGTTTLTYAGGLSLPAYGYWVGVVIQTYGTDAGKWEVVRITNTSGTSLTLNQALINNYVTGAQVYVLKQYKDLTISGTLTPSVYNGSIGGMIFLLAKSITINAAINAYGNNGSSIVNNAGEVAGGQGYGFCGGRAKMASTQLRGWQGGGTGIGQTDNYGGTYNANYANGNGGGSGNEDGAGGGGNASAGWSNAQCYGGNAAGNLDLTEMVMGGGGAGQYRDEAYQDGAGSGGAGGGLVVLIAKTITNNSTINLNGGNGGYAAKPPAGGQNYMGGAGAGGSCLVVCDTATLGSSAITAAGGGIYYWYNPTRIGGYTSNGRIAVHHAKTITGTTSPTYIDITDPTLIEGGAGSFLFTML